MKLLLPFRVRAAAALLAACLAGGCAPDGENVQIRVASTTSLYDTGLLDELVPAFQAAHPEYEAQVVAVGTGEARDAGLEPGDDWYLDVGQGMGSTLLFAAERRGGARVAAARPGLPPPALQESLFGEAEVPGPANLRALDGQS